MAYKRVALLTLTLVFVLGLASAAFAQAPRFNVSSTPFQQRATGVTETAGDIVLTLENAGGATIAQGTNLSVSMIPFTAAITNTPNVLNVNFLTTRAGGPWLPTEIRLSVGVLPNTLTISFLLDVFLAQGEGLRIRAIRINDQASGVVFPDQVRAELTVTPAGAIGFSNTNIVAVSTPLQTLAVTYGTIPNLLQCLAQSVTRSIIVTEQFPAVFTDILQETFLLSNTPPPTNSTQVEVFLTTVPGGLTVQAPVAAPLVAGGVVSTASLVLAAAPTGCSVATGLCTGATTRDISLIYNVTGNPDLGQVESATLNFTFTTTGVISTQLLGCAGAQVRLVPLSTTALPARPGDAGTPRGIVPRFIDPFQPAQPRQVVCVVACSCTLKFTFVTNQAGFDTGLAIANTTMDPFGTPGQNGTIDLFFYGANQPTPNRVTTGNIQAGQTYTNLVSALARNFQGYIIAIANFQFCEGFAFIADSNFGTIAEGYLALVIPDPNQFGGRRQPGFPLAGTLTGTVVGTSLNAVVTINDAFGERLVH